MEAIWHWFTGLINSSYHVMSSFWLYTAVAGGFIFLMTLGALAKALEPEDEDDVMKVFLFSLLSGLSVLLIPVYLPAMVIAGGIFTAFGVPPLLGYSFTMFFKHAYDRVATRSELPEARVVHK